VSSPCSLTKHQILVRPDADDPDSQHKRFHTKKHICPEDGCDGAFSTKKDLGRHQKSKHDRFLLPQCAYCKKRMRPDNLRRHETQQHAAEMGQGSH
jgi:hypothetical protein